MQLRGRIKRAGPMPFAEFMQRALYDPEHGYYARIAHQTGYRGDFMTSVSVGPLFGELLACRFNSWLHELGEQSSSLQLVETGAHDGQLAADILQAMQRSEPALVANLEYWIIEPSPGRQSTQRRTLSHFGNVHWTSGFGELTRPVHGVIFSNELLDAMPVHPFAWDAAKREWQELGVTCIENRFAWCRIEKTTAAPPELPQELLAVLPDGYVVEVSPAAERWWREAANALAHGRLMTIDYGGTLEELLLPERISGTLRAYSRHHVGGDVLADPGERDITAHVNFTSIRHVGEAAGLRTESFSFQSQFLTEIARENWSKRSILHPAVLRQFQTLTHPEHLGRPFRVLVQAR